MKRITSKLLSLLLTLAMLMSMVPVTYAVDETGSDTGTVTTEYGASDAYTTGNDTAVVQSTADVAAIGEKGYATLDAAIEAAEDGATITLLGNTTVETYATLNKSVTINGGSTKYEIKGLKAITGSNVTLENVYLNQTATLDIGGTDTKLTNCTIGAKDLTNNYAWDNYSFDHEEYHTDGYEIFTRITGTDVTLTGCTFDGTAKVTEDSDKAYFSDLCLARVTGEDVVMKNCNFNEATYACALSAPKGTWTLDGCKFSRIYHDPIEVVESGNKPVVTVNNCDLVGCSDFNDPEATIIFTNCRFGKTADHNAAYYGVYSYGKTTFTDCTFTEDYVRGGDNTAAWYNGLFFGSEATVEINDCTVDGDDIKNLLRADDNNVSGIAAIDAVKDADGKYISGTFVGSETAIKAAIASDATYNAETGEVTSSTSSTITTSKQLVAAIAAAKDGDTITLGEGNFTTYGNASPKKSLTFVGSGEKTVWTIGDLTQDYKNEQNGDYSFDGCDTITFKNMTLKVDNKNYRGFIRINNTVVENCTMEGRTSYWGYKTASFEDTVFNAPGTDYAIWDYSSDEMTFKGCTFNTEGKAIHVYREMESETTDTVKVTLEDCTVNSTVENKAVLNIKNKTNDGGKNPYEIELIGDNKHTIKNDDDTTTEGKLWQVASEDSTQTTTNGVTIAEKKTGETEFKTVLDVKAYSESTAVAKVGEAEYATLAEAFAALDNINYDLTLIDESVWSKSTPVYWQAGELTGYSATLAEALTLAYMVKADSITIVCRPGADVGTMTHGHVADDLTIYGNNAYISGGECDLEVDTFMFSRETGKQVTSDGEYLGKDITITAYQMNNLGVWGQRHTNKEVNVELIDCDSVKGITVQRVYISGTTGDNNITLTDCDFATENTAVYSNADGAIKITDCSFTDSKAPVNINHKAGGDVSVVVSGSKFDGCGDNGDWGQFAAPIRFVNSGSGYMKATVQDCAITNTVGSNGDILLGDGRTGQKSNDLTLVVEDTAATVMAQKPGYYTDGGTNAGKAGTATSPASGTYETSVDELIPSETVGNGTEAKPYTLAQLSTMTRDEYIAAQERLRGTMYVTVDDDYSYTTSSVLGNGKRDDTTGQKEDRTVLNGYNSNGYLGEKNDGANGKNIVFVGGTITSGVTGYASIDNIGTDLLLAVPAYTNVTFKGTTFNNVISFNYQLYTSPWSQLGELKFDGCTFNGIIVGGLAAQTLTFNQCTFTNYTNTVSANNSNPTWIRPAYGNWTKDDNEGQGGDFKSLTTINFTGNTVTSTRPVKFERIAQWEMDTTVIATGNSFDIKGDGSNKNVGMYFGANAKFDLVADDNTKADTTAALYTAVYNAPNGDSYAGLPAGSTVKDSEGAETTLDALAWKTTDKLTLETTEEIASVTNAKGTANFATLAAALEAAKNGETVTLLADVTEDVTISKDITLDLGGKTLTNTNAGKATLTIANDADATVKNGSIIGGTGHYNIAVGTSVKSTAKLMLKDIIATAGNTGSSMLDNWGTLTIESGTYTGGLNVVKSEEGSTLTINGGTFTRTWAPKFGITGTILVYGKTTITGGTFTDNSTSTNARVLVTGVMSGYPSLTTVTGGHFTGKYGIFHNMGDATYDNFDVAGGTYSKSVGDGFFRDGYFAQKVDGVYKAVGPFAAKIGTIGYDTLDAALEEAKAGNTVIVLQDASDLELTVDKNLTITGSNKQTLNNVKITASGRINLTVSNLDFTGDSYINANGCAKLSVDKCVANVTPTKITGRAAFIVLGTSEVTDGLTLTVNKSTIIASKGDNANGDAYAAAIFGWNYITKAEITGNTFGSEATPYNFIAVKMMNATAGATYKINTNMIYGSNANGGFYAFDLYQNNSRDNAYLATFDGNSLINTNASASSEDFYFVDVECNGAGNAKVNAKSSNKVNGKALTAADLLVETADASLYTGVDIKTDSDGKVIGGTLAANSGINYLADGYVANKNEDGTYSVAEDVNVAEVKGVKYESLQAAFDAATAGDTVKLLKNFTLTEQVNITTALNDLTLDGNGKTITLATSTDPSQSGGSALYFGNPNKNLWCTGIKIKDLTMTGMARYAIFLSGGTTTEFTNVNISGNYYIAINLYGTHGATMTDCNISNSYPAFDKYGSAIWTNVASANPLKLVNTKVDTIAINAYTTANKLEPKIYVMDGSEVGEIHTFDDGSVSMNKKLCVSKTSTGSYTIKEYVDNEWVDLRIAKIGDTYYDSLEAAFAAAKDGNTIEVVSHSCGNGIVVKVDTFTDKGLIVDFGGYTYTVGGVLVGSTATASNGFQLNKNNKITFQNGAIYGDASVAGDDKTDWTGAPAILIQNYCDLTLSEMKVSGGSNTVYTLSNNCGNTVIENTTINAGNGTSSRAPFALDACGYSGYDGVSVTVKGTSVINGNIEVSRSSNNSDEVKLALEGGTITGELKIDSSIKSGDATTITKSDDVELTAPAGYEWSDDGTLTAIPYVAEVGGTKHRTIEEAAKAAKSGDTITLLADVTNTDYTVANVVNISLASGVTLDGNGHTLSGNVKITAASAGGVTIKNVNFKDIHNDAVVSDAYKNKYGFSADKVGTLSAIYASNLTGALTITGCTFENCDWEAMQITPKEGATISITNNIFKTSDSDVVKEQLRHVHVEMAYGNGVDYEGTDIKLTVTDNQFLTDTKEANMGIWWVGKESDLELTGNYYKDPDAVSITLSDKSFNRENRCDLIYPARSQKDVDVDDLLYAGVAMVIKDAFNVKSYKTLAEAIAAAKSGETIKLLGDLEDTEANAKDGVIYDLTGKTLDLNGKTYSHYNLAHVFAGTNGTIKNGKMVGLENASYALFIGDEVETTSFTVEDVELTGGINIWAATGVVLKNLTVNGADYYAVFMDHDSSATIEGGIYTAGESAAFDAAKDDGVFGNKGTLNIASGTINTNGKPLMGKSGGTLSISGGTFDTAVAPEYCADGFIPQDNGDGTYTVEEYLPVEVWSGYTSGKVENGSYATIAEAAQKRGANRWIIIAKDYTLDEDFTIPEDVFLDVAANATLTVAENVTLTVAADAKRLGVRDDAKVVNNGTILVCGTTQTNGVVSKVGSKYNGEIDVTKLTVEDGMILVSNGAGVTYYAAKAAFEITYGDGSTKKIGTQLSGLEGAVKLTMLKDVTGFDGYSFTRLDGLAENFVFDLGGYTLSGKSAAVDVLSTSVPMTIQNGTIKYTSSDEGHSALFTSADVIIAADAVIDGGKGFGINLDSYSGRTLTVNGTVKSDGGYAITSNGREEEGGDIRDCDITVNDGAVISAPNGVAIYHPEKGTVTINGGTITGKTGVQMCSGELFVNGGTISATATETDIGSDGGIVDGAAISIINRGYPGGAPTATITKGTFNSASGVAAVQAYTVTETTKSDWTDAGANVNISGGTFSSIPSNMDDLCKFGYVAKQNGNYYTVEQVNEEAAYVDANGKTKYDTLVKALANAKSGTITLLKEVTDDELIIILDGVTLDLNGNELTAKMLFANAGTMKDSKEGVGSLKLKDNSWMGMPKGNPYLPIYDNGVYRFFGYQLEKYGTENKEGTGTLFAYKVTFNSLKALELLAGSGKETHGVSVQISLSWDGLDSPMSFDVSQSAFKNGLDNMKDGDPYYLWLTVTKFGTSLEGKEISTSMTIGSKGVETTVAGDSYTVPKTSAN